MKQCFCGSALLQGLLFPQNIKKGGKRQARAGHSFYRSSIFLCNTPRISGAQLVCLPKIRNLPACLSYWPIAGARPNKPKRKQQANL